MAVQRITYEQVEQITAGMDRKTAQMTESAILRISNIELEIDSHLSWVESAMDRVRKCLATGESMNSRGEFGTHTVEIDKLIALQNDQYRTLADLAGAETATRIRERRDLTRQGRQHRKRLPGHPGAVSGPDTWRHWARHARCSPAHWAARELKTSRNELTASSHGCKLAT